MEIEEDQGSTIELWKCNNSSKRRCFKKMYKDLNFNKLACCYKYK